MFHSLSSPVTTGRAHYSLIWYCSSYVLSTRGEWHVSARRYATLRLLSSSRALFDRHKSLQSRVCSNSHTNSAFLERWPFFYGIDNVLSSVSRLCSTVAHPVNSATITDYSGGNGLNRSYSDFAVDFVDNIRLEAKDAKDARRELSRFLEAVEKRVAGATYSVVLDDLAAAARLAARAAGNGSAPSGYSLLSEHRAFECMVQTLRRCYGLLERVRPVMLHRVLQALLACQTPPHSDIFVLLVNDLSLQLKTMKMSQLLSTVGLARQISSASQSSVITATSGVDNGSSGVERHSLIITSPTRLEAHDGFRNELLSASVNAVEQRWFELKSYHHLRVVLEHHKLYSNYLLQRVEDEMLNVAPRSNLAELTQLLQHLASAGRRPLPVIRCIAHHLSRRSLANTCTPAETPQPATDDQPQGDTELTINQCVRTLDALGKLSFTDDVVFELLADVICSHLRQMSSDFRLQSATKLETFSSRVLSVLVLCGQLRWRCPRLLDPLVGWLLTTPGRQFCSAIVASRTLHSLATVDYLPDCWSELLPLMLHRLSDDYQMPCVHRVNAVWSLAALDALNDRHMLESVLSPTFGEQLLKEAPTARVVHLRLLNLLAVAATRPNYSGPRLSADLVQRLATPLVPTRASAELSGHVLSVLHHHMPAAKYMRPTVPADASDEAIVSRPANMYGLPVEAEFAVLRDSCEPVPWCSALPTWLENPADFRGSAMPKCTRPTVSASKTESQKLEKSLCSIVLKVWSYHDFTVDTRSGQRSVGLTDSVDEQRQQQRLCGHNKLHRRLLNDLGYRVLEVPYSQFRPSEPTVRKLKWLISEIKKLVNE